MSDAEPINLPRLFGMPLVRGRLDSPPPAVVVDVDFGARSRRSPGRFLNDDHYLILRIGRSQETLVTSLREGVMPSHFEEFGYGMVIADGMGSAGEAASRLAVSTLVHLAIYFGRWNVRIDEPIADEVMDRAERYYRQIDSVLLQASRETSPAPLETTLTVAYTAGTDLFFAHVGHSRAYVFRDGALMQLTRDHPLERERPGKRAFGETAGPGCDHHTATDTLGGPGSDRPRVDIERCEVLDGDLVLLCTSGLTDVVDDARIATALRLHRTPDDQCGALVDLAAAAGGNKDVTVLVAHYHIPA